MDDEDSIGKSKGRVLFETANTHISVARSK
jgi:hypothetical protein